MPENRALSGLCSGIIEAYDLFGVPTAIVVFVVEEVSYNICDQRFHEFEISDKRPDIQVKYANIYESKFKLTNCIALISCVTVFGIQTDLSRSINHSIA